MYFWLIEEENHGTIGAAVDRTSVIDFLIKNYWLYGGLEYWDNEKHETALLSEWANRKGYEDWKDFLFTEPTDANLENLGFYISQVKVHKAD